MGQAASILLVDDDSRTLDVLTELLTYTGYHCVACSSAEDALERFPGERVDAAILDVNLPGMDGVELGAELKRQTRPDFFPIILIGGIDLVATRVRGLEAGCDDFMGKPLSMFELDARMASLLERRRQHKALAHANEQLQSVQEKKRELAALVVHDLRNPLSAILGNVELLADELSDASDWVRRILVDLDELAIKSLSMIGGLLDVEDLEEGLLVANPTPIDVGQFFQEIARYHTARLKARKLTVDFDVNVPGKVQFDRHLIGRVVENLLDNAVRYAPQQGRVIVRASRTDAELMIRVGNNGPPVPPAERERVFDRFHRIEARRAGARANRGLGLYFCKLAALACGGTICVEELEELPACFTVRLPV